MKKIYVILSLLIMVILPACSKGTQAVEPVAEAVTETVEKVEVAEEIKPEENKPFDAELAMKLNQAGFDVPKETLPSIEFELTNLEGISEKLSDYKGKVVFLNFWATWCGPCRSEMPAMEIVYNDLKDDGFVILAVDLGEDSGTVQDFVDEFGLTFPVVLDQTNAVGTMYNAQSIPTTYLLSREGNILGRAVGARPWEDEIYMNLFREILEM